MGELDKFFSPASQSESVDRAFERLYPLDRLLDLFDDWCYKCDVVVSTEKIFNGWTFSMNKIKVMDRFAAKLETARYDFYRNVSIMMFKSDFFKIESIYDGTRFVSFFETYLEAVEGARRYDAVCHWASSAPATSEALRRLLDDVFRRLRKRTGLLVDDPQYVKRHREDSIPSTDSQGPTPREKWKQRQEETQSGLYSHRETDRHSQSKPSEASRQSQPPHKIPYPPADSRPSPSRPHHSTASVSPISSASLDSPAKRPGTQGSREVRSPVPEMVLEDADVAVVAVVEGLKPPLPKFLAQAGPKVVAPVGKPSREPSPAELRLAEAMLSLKLRFKTQFGADVVNLNTAQLTQLMSGGPDVIELMKEEFVRFDLFFETSISDGGGDGDEFSLEVILYSKCANCVFDCHHHGNDKILVFKYTISLDAMGEATSKGYRDLALKMLRASYLKVSDYQVPAGSTKANKVLTLSENHFDAPENSFRYDHLCKPRYNK